jgi:hypothetical protein
MDCLQKAALMAAKREKVFRSRARANLEKHGWIGGSEATRRSMRHVR